jgi:hypothetical protein
MPWPIAIAIAKREHNVQLRELTDQVHGANTDLGTRSSTTSRPWTGPDIDVARCFVYALMGADHDRSPEGCQ